MDGINAQTTVYPLRQDNLSPAIEAVSETFSSLRLLPGAGYILTPPKGMRLPRLS